MPVVTISIWPREYAATIWNVVHPFSIVTVSVRPDEGAMPVPFTCMDTALIAIPRRIDNCSMAVQMAAPKVSFEDRSVGADQLSVPIWLVIQKLPLVHYPLGIKQFAMANLSTQMPAALISHSV